MLTGSLSMEGIPPSAGRLAEGSPDGYFNARRVGAPSAGLLMPGVSVRPIVPIVLRV